MAGRVGDISLSDKKIMIIGGTTGMGLASARAFVEAGAHVVVVGKTRSDTEAAEDALGARARGMTADVTEPGTADAAIELAVSRFGELNGLFHVAGGSGRRSGDGPLHDVSDDGWTLTLDLNLTSVMRSNRAAIRQFLRQGSGGSILNMGSVLGFSPSREYFASHAYATAKAAIIGLSRSAAACYAPHDIRVNVLAPALVETPMSARAIHDERIMAFIRTKQPLDGGRIGKPEDITAAATYFMSDASRFVTGQVLAVDGGWSVTDGQISRT